MLPERFPPDVTVVCADAALKLPGGPFRVVAKAAVLDPQQAGSGCCWRGQQLTAADLVLPADHVVLKYVSGGAQPGGSFQPPASRSHGTPSMARRPRRSTAPC